jgi:hypothetical protein
VHSINAPCVRLRHWYVWWRFHTKLHKGENAVYRTYLLNVEDADKTRSDTVIYKTWSLT